MMQSLCGKVCIVRFLLCFEVAKVALFAIKLNSCAPCIGPDIQSYAKKTASVVRAWLSLILKIYRARNVPQIFDLIVAADPVYMVNVPCGEQSMHVNPCKTMGTVKAA